MTCRDVTHLAETIRFCPDDVPNAADRLRAVVGWRAVDEITGRAPDIEFSLTASHPGLAARVSRDGVMGVVGNPGRLFPDLALSSAELELTLKAPGYLTRTLAASIGPIAGFPAAFTATDLGIVALHRMPLVVRGRVVRQAGLTADAIGAATVSLVGIWETWPAHDVDFDLAMKAPNVVALSPGFYAPRVSGTDALRRRDVTLALGQEKMLLDPAIRGARHLLLSDALGLAPGDLLAIDAGERREWITISAIDMASSSDQPAKIALGHALAFDHFVGVDVVRAVAALPSADRVLTRHAITGDCIAFVSSVAGLPSGSLVEITGSAPPEYHTLRRYEVVSDSDAYYRMPPLSRLAAVRIRAERFDLPSPLEVVVGLEYRRYEHRFDLVFP